MPYLKSRRANLLAAFAATLALTDAYSLSQLDSPDSKATGLRAGCDNAYTSAINGCTDNDFGAGKKCSDQCLSGLEFIVSLVHNKCGSRDPINEKSVLSKIVKGSDGKAELCSGQVTPDTSNNNDNKPTAPAPAPVPAPAPKPENDNHDDHNDDHNDHSPSPPIVTSPQNPPPPPQAKSSSSSTSTSASATATATPTRSTSTLTTASRTSTPTASGGGSPFDNNNNNKSSDAGVTKAVVAHVILGAIVPIATLIYLS